MHAFFRIFLAIYFFSMPYSLLVAPIFFSDMYIPHCSKIANTPILQSHKIYVSPYPINYPRSFEFGPPPLSQIFLGLTPLYFFYLYQLSLRLSRLSLLLQSTTTLTPPPAPNVQSYVFS